MTTKECRQGSHKVVVDLDTFIKEVYDLLGHSWKFLARELGFSKTDIDALEHDNPYLMKEQIYQMFDQWKRREGNGATSDKLLAAMKSAGGFDEQVKILTGKGMIEYEKSSADLASSLAAGVRLPIQASDDAQVQTDSPVKPKLMATDTPSPSIASDDVRSDGPFRSKKVSPESASTSSPREKELGTTKPSPTASTPPSERDFIRQQRLKRFSSDRSDTNSASCSEQRVLDSPPREVAGSDRPLSGAAMRTSSAPAETSSPTFEVGECIQVDRPDSAPWYGVIRWIGTLPGTSTAPLAGMEMEHVVKGGGDGSIAGARRFTCAEGHGLFLPLSRLKRDDRFDALDNAGEVESSESSPRVERSTNPVSDPLSDLMSRLLTPGGNRGTEQSDASSDSEPGGCRGFELQIPADRAGLVIGAGGKNIREVERLTNTSIKVDGGGLGIYGGGNRKVRVLGSEENCKKALLLILKKVERRVDEHMAGVKTMSVPDRCVRKIIGKGGATISTIKSLSGAHDIKFDDRKTVLEAMLQTERLRQCHIHGSEEAIQKAEILIRSAVNGEDIVAGATLAAIFMELLKLGVQCQEEDS